MNATPRTCREASLAAPEVPLDRGAAADASNRFDAAAGGPARSAAVGAGADHDAAARLGLAELAGRLAAAERAGDWAHALGSPLGAIAQFAEGGAAMARRRGADPELVEAFEDIGKQVERAKRTLEAIRGFARAESPIGERADLGDLVRAAVEAHAPAAAARRVTLRRELADALPGVIVDPRQLAAALANLTAYALDRAAAQPAGERLVRYRTAVEGERVCAAVGVAASAQPIGAGDAAIDAFFLAAEAGSAPGVGAELGLGAARLIAEHHGGKLVHRADGGWAEFMLQLPLGIKSQWLMARPTSG